ncbi:SRPBCC family protein [Trujillonella humicola]|uniref:SRPBCC family protein n=1 Tax=Trujillonella humicola TaxID=3383699 RepID=UPI003905B0AA
MDAVPSTDLGTYVEHDGRPAVRFVRTYPHPVERVWRAVSDPAELAHWFPSTVTIEPREGGRITFSADPYAVDAEGVVLAWEPPHRLAFSWYEDEVHLTLEEADGGCRLTLLNVLDDRAAAARNASGWFVCLRSLARLLDGRPGSGPHGDDGDDWQPVYAAHVATGLPSGAEIPKATDG